jgi:hypothetical protein
VADSYTFFPYCSASMRPLPQGDVFLRGTAARTLPSFRLRFARFLSNWVPS